MNRHERRRMESTARKQVGEAPTPSGVAHYLVARMAQRGTQIVTDLRAAVGHEPTSGHTVDALMTEAARFEQALVLRNYTHAVDAAVCVLFLARALAIREGKIQIEKIAQA